MSTFYHVGSMAVENAIKNLAQFNQRLEIDRRILMQGHRRTEGTIKHPCWNLEASACNISGTLAAGNDATSQALRNADSNGLSKKGVPRIADFTRVGLLCLVLQGCITGPGLTWRWKKTRRSLVVCSRPIREG